MKSKSAAVLTDPIFLDIQKELKAEDGFLYVVPIPTGSGKSYRAVHTAISQIDWDTIRQNGDFRSIEEVSDEFKAYCTGKGQSRTVFVSAQHKLLPVKSLKEKLAEKISTLPGNLSRLCPDDLFVKIPSNWDAVGAFLKNRGEQDSAFKKLLKQDPKLKSVWESLRSAANKYENHSEDEVVCQQMDEKEREFRRYLGSLLKKDVANISIPEQEKIMHQAFPEIYQSLNKNQSEKKRRKKQRELKAKERQLKEFIASLLLDVKDDGNATGIRILMENGYSHFGAEFAEKWGFVKELYPSVLYERRPIVLMTSLKFQYAGSDLYRDRKPYRKDDSMKNALVFIDESDAVKTYEFRNQLRTAGKELVDLKTLTDTILKNLDNPLTFNWLDADNERIGRCLQNMKAEALKHHEAIEKHGLDHSFKKMEAADQYLFLRENQSSVEHSGSLYYAYSEEKYCNLIFRPERLRKEKKKLEKLAPLQLEDEKRLAELRSLLEKKKPLYVPVQCMNGFLNIVIASSKRLAEVLAEEDVSKPKERHLNNIYDALINGDDRKVRVLQDHTYTDFLTPEKRKENPLAEIYTHGLSAIILRDNLSKYDYRSDIGFFGFVSSPENELIHLVNSGAKVVLLSATADFNSYLVNYNMNYLQTALESKYCSPDKQLQLKYQDYYEQQYMRGYDQVEICSFPLHLAKRTKKGGDRLNDYRSRLAEILETEPNRALNGSLFCSHDPYVLEQRIEVASAVRTWLEKGCWAGLLMFNYNFTQDSTVTANDFRKMFKCLVEKLIPEEEREKYHCIIVNNADGNDFTKQKETAQKFLAKGDHVLMATCYATAGLGQNFYYSLQKDTAEKADLVETGTLKRHLEKENEGMIRVDIDYLYLQRKKNLRPSVGDFKRDGSVSDWEKMLEIFWNVTLAYHTDEIDYETMNSQIDRLTRELSYAGSNSDIAAKGNLHFLLESQKDLPSTRTAALVCYYQAIGRMLRSDAKRPRIFIVYGDDILDPRYRPETDILEFTNGGTPVFPREFTSFLKSLENETARKNIENVRAHRNNLKQSRLYREHRERSLEILKRSMRNDEEAELYQQLREDRHNFFLRYPCGSLEELKDAARRLKVQGITPENIEHFYLPVNQELHYYGTIANKYDYFVVGKTRQEVAEQLEEYKRVSKNAGEEHIMSLSEQGARLDLYMKNPQLKAYFEQQGWKTSLDGCEYILQLHFFNDAYKGMLGEVAGTLLFESELNLKLGPMPSAAYERFDRMSRSGKTFVDFKNYSRFNFGRNQKGERKERFFIKLAETAERLGKEKQSYLGIICNVGFIPKSVPEICDFKQMPVEFKKQYESYLASDARLVFIPSLLNKDGSINMSQLSQLEDILRERESNEQ